MTLTEFLRARIAEDEVVARSAAISAHDAPNAYKPHPELTHWRYRADGEVEYDYDDPHPYPSTYYVTCDNEGLLPSVTESVGPHIARWDPARVLAECEAKRRIVSDYAEWVQIAESDPDADYATNSVGRLADVLWSLAFPFSNHEDFREEWRP